jgi:hypothetical protein
MNTNINTKRVIGYSLSLFALLMICTVALGNNNNKDDDKKAKDDDTHTIVTPPPAPPTNSNNTNSNKNSNRNSNSNRNNNRNSNKNKNTNTNTQTQSAVSNSTADATSNAVATNNGNGSNNTNTTLNAPEIPASTALAPGLVAGNDSCVGSIAGAGQSHLLGLSIGGTKKDENCILIKQVQLLRSMGLEEAACYRARAGSAGKDIDNAMKAAGVDCSSIDARHHTDLVKSLQK